jgi:hypothetical protein
LENPRAAGARRVRRPASAARRRVEAAITYLPFALFNAVSARANAFSHATRLRRASVWANSSVRRRIGPEITAPNTEGAPAFFARKS